MTSRPSSDPRKETDADNYVRRVLSAFIQNRPVTQGPADATDWMSVGQTVAMHGLEGVFLHALKGIHVPHEMIDAWQKRTMAVLFDNLRSLRTAVKLFSILEDNKIPAVAMRGLKLAHKDYVSAGMRSMGDIDILIAPEDRDRFLNVVARSNLPLENVLRSQYILKIDGVLFEIHWSFLTARRYREQLKSSVLLSSRQRFTSQEGSIYGLSVENELIGLVTHSFVHHELGVLKQLLDIAIYMTKPELDWHYIRHWCEGARLTRMFDLTLRVASRFFMLKSEGFQQAFGDRGSPRIERTLPDYINPFFGQTSFRSYLHRKGNLLYVAENPMKKLEQLICFVSFKEVQELFHRLFRSPPVSPLS